LAPYGLWWFEDICDPLDFDNLAAVASRYTGPIAAGEALFSTAEAKQTMWSRCIERLAPGERTSFGHVISQWVTMIERRLGEAERTNAEAA
jgi:hypothetical protein